MDPTQASQIVIDLKLALALAAGAVAVVLAITITVSSWISVRSARSAAREGGASAADRSQAAVGGGPILQQQIGGTGAQPAPLCRAETEHGSSLQRLVVVQEQQTVLLRELREDQRRRDEDATHRDERMVELLRAIHERMGFIEREILGRELLPGHIEHPSLRTNGG